MQKLVSFILLCALVIGVWFGILMVAMFVDIGSWALDRFQDPWRDAVIIKQGQVEQLWLCADGTPEKPLNCVSAAEVVEFARRRWSDGGSVNVEGKR